MGNTTVHLVNRLVKLFVLMVGNYWLLPVWAMSQAELLEYQAAAPYTHIQIEPIPEPLTSIQLEPLQNRSGIAIGSTAEKHDYYNHGKLPAAINDLLHELVEQQGWLAVEEAAQYRFTFTLLDYHLPLPYAPDDKWYQALHDQVDRWGLRAVNSEVMLRLTVAPNKTSFALAPFWHRDIRVALSNCDLNRQPQPLVKLSGHSPSLDAYRHSLPGQALIAAVNYLTYQALLHLGQSESVATVVGKQNNALVLYSEHQALLVGDKLRVYPRLKAAEKHNQLLQIKAQRPLGEVWIAESDRQLALAYPVNFRPDQARIGDSVRFNKSQRLAQQPKLQFVYKPTRQCASVVESVAAN